MVKIYESGNRLLQISKKSKLGIGLICILLFLPLFPAIAQNTTHWKGTSSNGWFTAANWTNGVPTSTSDVIIGDANFTGVNPVFSSTTTIKSLTIGSTKAVSFSLLASAILNVSGNVTIAASGTLSHTASSIKIAGNWSNSGTYTTASATKGNKITYATAIFNGSSQSITGVTPFMALTISQNSTTSLSNAISVSKAFSVSGTFDPGSNLVTLTGSTFTIGSTGIIKVKTTDFTSNYSLVPTTLNTGCTIDYAASDRAQNIASFSSTKPYSTLIISGGTSKTLTSNISFAAASTTDGKLLVNSGILDMGSFTANRAATTTGGTISIANLSTLKIGGSNTTFPANFTTRTIGATSTVEYSGNAQTVTNVAYGNLTLSGTSGNPVKTMPASALIVAGNLTTSVGTATSLTFTAVNTITVNGNLTLGSGTTFNGTATNGSSLTHTIAGDWTNAGTFTGNASTINLSGIGKTIAGTAQSTFNNLTITGSITGRSASIGVGGNLATSGAGTFTHSAQVNNVAVAGTLTMSGTSKTISGTDLIFDNLTISGTVSSANDLAITGNLNVSNSSANAFNLTAGTITMSGTDKTLSAAGTSSLNLNALRITGTITTSSSFSIKSNFSGSSIFTATAGTITFTGSSTFGGTHKLFGVTLNGTLLQLASNSTLGIAGTFTNTAGNFDVTTTSPNTVEYNGTDQNITGTTYHTLKLAGTGIKTALNNTAANGNIEIGTGVNFAAGNFTFTVKGNWLNSGTFIPGNSTVQFTGVDAAQLTGVTTFSTLTLNKTTTSALLTLNNNVTVATLNMTNGEMRTGSNAINITSTRNGTGIILGTITRTHNFSSNTAYAFEGPANLLSFGSVSGVTSVTVTVTSGSVSGFPFGGSVNRLYTISIPAGTYSNATLRLHYTDSELNGNAENLMSLWKYSTSWATASKTSNNTTDNYIEKTGLASITGQWTLSDDNVVLEWKGETSSDWHTASNWAAVQGTASGRVPLATDIVNLGGYNFTYAPIISANAAAKSIQFSSIKNTTLTLSAGTLTVAGNINGSWSGHATHTLAVGSNILSVGGDIVLSDGTTSHVINLSVGTGTISVSQSLTQTGNAQVQFSGAGNLSVGQDFNYINGTFSAGAGTVTYTGSNNQFVAGAITYNNLVIDKSAGSTTTWSAATVTGDLTLLTAANLVTNGSLTITGNVNIGAGTTFNSGAYTHTIGGNWTLNGTFTPGAGTVKFNGTGSQAIMSSTFNNLTINKTSGTATLTGNVILNAALNIEAGSLNLASYTLVRSTAGGTFTLGAGANVYVSGTNNFPANFNNNLLESTSTVNYNGTGIQNLAKVSYGHLVLENGSTNVKSLTGTTIVKGNLTISSGATLGAVSYSLTTLGNIINNGTFDAGTGTIILAGTTKTTDGALLFNDLTVTGSYTLNSGSFTVNNNFYNSGSLTAGINSSTFSGNFVNAGSMASDGITVFSGEKEQTIQLIGTLTSTAAGIVYFNGTKAPILNSNSLPSFVSVIINNTAGISPSIDWTVYGLFKVASGATFNGGSSNHTFYGNFINEGTITSAGVLNFLPSANRTVTLGTTFTNSGTLKFGGSGLINLNSSPTNHTNIEISNINETGLTAPLGWNISGNLSIKAGSIFNAGSGLSHIVAGNIENNGTLNDNGSTFTLNATTSSIEGTGTSNFYNLIINDSTTIATSLNIKGNFTNNGVLAVDNIPLYFSGTTAQNIDGTATTAFYDLVISNSASTVSATTNLEVANSFTINSGSTFKPAATVILNNTLAAGSISGSGTIEVTRTEAPSDYINQYKFSAYDLSNLTVKFSGTSAQSSSLTSFNNLTIDNIAGFTLTAPTTVTGTLRLEDGNIYSNGNTLTVGTSTSNTGAVEIIGAGMVLGKLKRWISNSSGSNMVFPVGTSSSGTAIRRSATIFYTTAPSGGTLTAEFVTTDPGTNGLPLTEPNGTGEDILLTKVGTTGYWTVIAGDGLTGGTYNATFEATSFGGISNLQNFVLLKRSDYTQPWALNGTHVSATGTASSPIISRTGLSGFSDFALGGNEPVTLPVEVIAFTASSKGFNAEISWKTAIEINNLGFDIEVSSDGANYRALGFVPSKNTNSLTVQSYQFTDTENGKFGTRYYRLKQKDLDGKMTYYGPKAVNFKESNQIVSVFPNPFVNAMGALIDADAAGEAIITLSDLNGKAIWVIKKQLQVGKNRIVLPDSEKLVKGIYLLKIESGNINKAIKLMKE